MKKRVHASLYGGETSGIKDLSHMRLRLPNGPMLKRKGLSFLKAHSIIITPYTPHPRTYVFMRLVPSLLNMILLLLIWPIQVGLLIPLSIGLYLLYI